MKPEWVNSPRPVPFFPKFRSLPRRKKSSLSIQITDRQELRESRRPTVVNDKFHMQTSAYLKKLQLERGREKEIRTKSLHNIPIHIRRLARLGSSLSIVNNAEHLKADTVEGFTKQTVVLPNIMSKQRQQSICSDVSRSEVKSITSGSENGSTTDPSCLEYHSEGEFYMSDESRDSLDTCVIPDIPYKCRRLWSVKNKKKYHVINRNHIPVKQTLALQLDRARFCALSKHVHFVNSSCITGQHVYRTNRMSTFDIPRMTHADDRPTLASRLQLMAIASVQEHNLPEPQDQRGPKSPNME